MSMTKTQNTTTAEMLVTITMATFVAESLEPAVEGGGAEAEEEEAAEVVIVAAAMGEEAAGGDIMALTRVEGRPSESISAGAEEEEDAVGREDFREAMEVKKAILWRLVRRMKAVN